MAYNKTITLTEPEDMFLQNMLQPFREATYPASPTNEAAIANSLLGKLEAADVTDLQ